jgi:hypothetical protein
MSELVDKIDKISDLIEGGSVDELRAGLTKLAEISPATYEVNRSNISSSVNELVEAINRNIQVNNEELSSDPSIKRQMQKVQ